MQPTMALGRAVRLRTKTSDRQVWSDVFVGAYHLPPDEMETPRSVLDLGANIGLTAAHYCAMWPEALVVGVEMDEQNAALARKNAPAAIILHCAVAVDSGMVSYNPNVPAEAYSIIGGGSSAVHAYALNEIIVEHFPHGHVDLLKMDIEGSEWPLLERASEWADRISNAIIELHDHDVSAEKSTELVARAVVLLEHAGFSAHHHPPHPRAVYARRG